MFLPSLEHPIHKTRVSVILERTYGPHGHLHSISFEQRPDIAVEIQTSDGPPRIYLFDPKYKLEGGHSGVNNSNGLPKKEDIDKMHAYRDTIRDQKQRRVVQYAAILYPGTYQRYGDNIEALQAYPGQEQPLEERLRAIFSVTL